MRRMQAVIAAGLFFISTAFAYDWSTNPGDGSAGNPYQIFMPEQMNSIGADTSLWDKCFILTDDINMSAYTGTQYNIIGNSTTKFTGVFDGNEHKISNLTYTTTNATDDVGLFGYTSNAVIKNLGIQGVNIASVGDFVGGLVGYMLSGTLANCYCSGKVMGVHSAGGLLGWSSGSISDCYNLCNVTGNGESGGFGGIAGSQYSGVIINCFNEGNVTGYSVVGGLVGMQEGDIRQSYNRGTVTATGTDIMSGSVGGITGFQMSGSIKDCYNIGDVEGYFFVGGITGYGGIMQNCYNAGLISGYGRTGGLSGIDVGIVNSFWDIETSGVSVSGGGKSRTSEQMKQASNYIGWNDEGQVWTLDEGVDYPHLVWEGCAGEYLPTHYLTEYVQGSGTEWDPYRIHSAEQLNIIGLFPDEWDKVFSLEEDIDLDSIQGAEFNKIGSSGIPFAGVFEGNEHIISNFTYITTANELFVGLFGYAVNAAIQNLELKNVNISSNRNGIGGILGSMESGILNNCICSGNVSGLQSVGGLAGAVAGTVINCRVHCTVTGNKIVGGLVGQQWSDTISNCYSTSTVTGIRVSENLGGTVGISDSEYIGGAIGLQSGGTIDVCYSTGEVFGKTAIGGLVGAQSQQWATEGETSAIISNCYSTGNVTGDDDSGCIGGLVGYQYIDIGTASISNCYSTGHVASGNNSGSLGGLIGFRGEVILNCFWDTQTSGLSVGVGYGSSSGVTGKITTEMMTLSTFTSAGWDFSDSDLDGDAADWMMLREGEDYPRLAWQEIYPGDIAGLYGVNLIDYAELARHWMDEGCPANCEDADIDGSGIVDLADLAVFSQHWLEGV